MEYKSAVRMWILRASSSPSFHSLAMLVPRGVSAGRFLDIPHTSPPLVSDLQIFPFVFGVFSFGEFFVGTGVLGTFCFGRACSGPIVFTEGLCVAGVWCTNDFVT